MQKHLKPVLDFAAKIFHDRRIVIVSEGKTSAISISRNFQIIVALLLFAAICWLPFSAGRLVAFSDLSSKKGLMRNLDNVEQRVEVLQNDILLLEEYLRALHKYDNFELEGTKGEEKRSSHFESVDDVSQLEEKRDEILVELKRRTLTRIYAIENFLGAAGLNYAKITGKEQFFANASKKDGVGGPYIPINLKDVQNITLDADITPEFIDELNYLFELQKIVNSLPFSNPLSYTKVSSSFGIRHDPFNGSLSMHSGMDLVGENNAYIAATAPGRVTFVGSKGAYGTMVEVYHGYGFATRYGHLSSTHVKVGDYVTRGQVIASQGCTGRCTGDHLHYEVRVNNVPVNPLTYLVKASEIQYYYAKKL